MGDTPLTYEQATAALTGPDGYFEVATEEVLGEPMQVFTNPAPVVTGPPGRGRPERRRRVRGVRRRR